MSDGNYCSVCHRSRDLPAPDHCVTPQQHALTPGDVHPSHDVREEDISGIASDPVCQVCRIAVHGSIAARLREPCTGPYVPPTRQQAEAMATIARRDAYDLFPGDRKAYPVLTGALMYFPFAFAELAKLSARANEQHNPGEPVHWDYSKSIGDGNELVRHLMDSLGPNPIDAEGVHHDVKVLWRAAETVERRIRRERGLPGPAKRHGQ